MSLVFDHSTLPQRVVFGSGSAEHHIVDHVRLRGAKRVLLISGRSGTALADAVAERVRVAARIGDATQHVPAAEADAATAAAHRVDADAIVSIGGGSATGLAKVVALRTGIPIIAVPTTFAGSEATDMWGLTQGGRKTTGTDARVLPAVVIYDATLSTNLPAHLAIASGLNAIAHAVDGFWAPGADPINRALGTEGLGALVAGLRRLHVMPDDLRARERTLYGAYLAAVAFASAGSGMHHKICHVLGGRFDLPHAEMHAVVLPYVIAFNVPAAPDAAARISAAFDGVSAAEALFRFNDELNAPRSLRELKFHENDIDEAAALVFEAIPATNPRPVVLNDLRELLYAAWAGNPLRKGQS